MILIIERFRFLFQYANRADITQAYSAAYADQKSTWPYDTIRGAVRCSAVQCRALIGWMNVGREDERGVVLARRSITSKAFFSSFFYYTPLAPLKSLVSRRTIG